MQLQDIPARYVPALAELLQLRPNEDSHVQSERITKAARALPSILRPSRLESLLLPPCGHLCKLHKELDYSVVNTILHHIQLEVGLRLNNLISQCQLLSPEQYMRIMRLRALHALWLSPKEYELTFLSPVSDLKWKFQTNECEACILSRLTGDLEVLVDLRWTIRSRANSRFVAKHGNPRLQIWVQAWIESMAAYIQQVTDQEIDLDALTLQNEEQATELKRLRAKIHNIRKKKLKIKDVGGKNGVARVVSQFSGVSSDASATESSESQAEEREMPGHHHDLCRKMLGEPGEAELEVIDTYAALISTPYLPFQPNPHTKYEFSESSTSVSADASTKGRSPYQNPHRAPVSGPVYNFDCTGTVALDSLPKNAAASEECEYVPPRSLWSKIKKPELLPFDFQFRPPYASSRDSWETEPLTPDARSRTSIYSSTQLKRTPLCQESRYDIPQPRHSNTDHHPLTPKRDPADTYTNLLDPSPFPSGPVTPPHHHPLPHPPRHDPPPSTSTLRNAPAPPPTSSQSFFSLYHEVAGAYTTASSTTTFAPSEMIKAALTPDQLRHATRKDSRRWSGIPRPGGGCHGLGICVSPEDKDGVRWKRSETATGGRQGGRGSEIASSSENTSSSSWGGAYESRIVSREDLGWFYKRKGA